MPHSPGEDLTAPLPATADLPATYESLKAPPPQAEPEAYADDLPQPATVPLDAQAEADAFNSLVAMINAHKDPGTEATVIDLDTFLSGLD